MQLTLTPTKLAGGVVIKGDRATLHSIERLLTRAAIESHICDDAGMCMTLSRYFEKKRDTVDWVTLISGVAALRHSLGYRLSKKNHAILCMLEHLIFEAMCKTISETPETIEETLDSLHGLNDRFDGRYIESRVTYLYLLKAPKKRKAELLKILQSLSSTLKYMNKEYNEQFEGLNMEMISYLAGTEFQYEL